MKGKGRASVLHVDLDPFFVSVERSLDPSLRERPVVVGGDGNGLGVVAAVSDEARRAGVRPGLPITEARRLCPDAAFRPGDLEAYGRVSEEVTAVLLAASRRVERPSADEAYVDLTPDTAAGTPPVRAAETIRDELQRRLGLDASLGLASSRLAARVASGLARPRGLLLVLPGYEESFLAGKSVAELGLPPHVESALVRAGLTTLGDVARADEAALSAAAGPAAARVRAAAGGEGEPPIALAAPPPFVQEELTIRDRRSDSPALVEIVDALARRAVRRLKPFRLAAQALHLEARRASESARRSLALTPGSASEDEIAALARGLAEDLLAPADGVRGLVLRLSKLGVPSSQAPLFPADRRHA